MEDSSESYYTEAELIIDEDPNERGAYCIGTAFGNERDCFIEGDVFNNGNTPLDFYAELWAEDSQGRQFKSEGKYAIFETMLNPGMSGYIRFNFVLNPGVILKKVYLVDVGGPVSSVILSAPVYLNSSDNT